MLSTPSGMPVESVYNVRNEKADGRYAGKHSRRGVEYVDHLFESDDRGTQLSPHPRIESAPKVLYNTGNTSVLEIVQ